MEQSSEILSGVRRDESKFVRLRPGPGLDADEVAADQRRRLRHAALLIVGENEVKGLTVRELTRVAGVSSRSFYRLYDGRDQCLCAAFNEATDKALRRLLSSERLERRWEERVRIALRVSARATHHDPVAARAVLERVPQSPGPVKPHVTRATGLFEEFVIRVFRSAPGAPVIPRVVARGIVAGIAGVLGSGLGDSYRNETTTVVDELHQWILSCSAKMLPRSVDTRRRILHRNVYTLCREMEMTQDQAKYVLITPTGGYRALLETVRERLRDGPGGDYLWGSLKGDASTEAVSRLIVDHIDRGFPGSLSELAPAFVFLAAAPVPDVFAS
jgi:AcrR family transcriptional regulator